MGRQSYWLIILKSVSIGSLIIFLVFLFLYWNTTCKSSFFDGLLGALLGFFITTVLAIIAYSQLSDISNTTCTDFIHKLKNDFFVEQTRILIDHIVEERIFFKEVSENLTENGNGVTSSDRQMGYFEVDPGKILESFPNQLKDILMVKSYYLEVELDDFLLGHFEDIGLFEEKGLIDTEMVYEEFSYYIFEVFENPEIKKYLDDADFCEWEFESDKSHQNETLTNPGHLYGIIVREIPSLKLAVQAKSPIDDLNELLKVPNLYKKIMDAKKDVNFSDHVQSLLKTTEKYKNLCFYRLKGHEQRNRKALNRLLLEETFPQNTPKNSSVRSDDYDADMYSKFTYIYYKLKAFESSKNNHHCLQKCSLWQNHLCIMRK